MSSDFPFFFAYHYILPYSIKRYSCLLMKPNCLLLEYISTEALNLLKQHTNVHFATTPSERLEIAITIPIKAIVTRGSGVVNEALIKNCKGLEIIARCGVGLDNINIKVATKNRIKVINAPGSNANTVAEHTFALILSAYRQIPTYANAAKRNNWIQRSQYEGDEIRGKTIGILGLGNIGQRVAYLATAFGLKVQYWNRTHKKVPYKKVDFDELLACSDILSLHLPQIPATNQLINQAAFEKMKPTVLLVNTARGTIIEEGALLNALENKLIGGFTADVLTQEPPIYDHAIFKFPNVLITPHTASLTTTTFNEMCLTTVKNLVAILLGETIEPHFINNYKALLEA